MAKAGELADLAALAQAASSGGPAWAYQGDELNATLLVLDAGDGIATHVNNEVDVLLVGVSGEGMVEVDGTAHTLRPSVVLPIAKGSQRSITPVGGRLAYLSCHRRRAPLWPKPRR